MIISLYREYNTHSSEKRAVRSVRLLRKILSLFHRMYVRTMYHEISVRRKGERWREIRKSPRTSNDGICVWLTPWNFTKFASSINRWTVIIPNKKLHSIHTLLYAVKSDPWKILSHCGQRLTWHTKHRWIRERFCFKALTKCLLSESSISFIRR